MSERVRVVFHELDRRSGTTAEVARAAGVSGAEVGVELRELNDRLRARFGYDTDPIDVDAAGGWRMDGIAGLVRLNERVELEIVPKFLDPGSATWRADFFVLAVLVQTGHLLAHDEITADAADRGALATLIARSLLAMHEEHQRRPIRGYRRRAQTDFSLDGDVDWESLALPEPDGFRMSRLELTKRNPYNATLASALETLVPEVSDADTQAQLGLRARDLPAAAAALQQLGHGVRAVPAHRERPRPGPDLRPVHRARLRALDLAGVAAALRAPRAARQPRPPGHRPGAPDARLPRPAAG